MTPFHVGMKVVCVDDNWTLKGVVNADDGDPLVGDVCTIYGMQADADLDSGIGFRLVGLPSNNFYCSANFRPAHENRMDELRSLLAPVPSKAKTLSPVHS